MSTYFNLLIASLDGFPLSTATSLLEMAAHTWRPSHVPHHVYLHLHFHKLVWLKAKQLIWNSIRCGEIPVAAMLWSRNGDLLHVLQSVVNTETKKLSKIRRFSRNHQHHHCCHGQQKLLHYFTKQFHPPNSRTWMTCLRFKLRLIYTTALTRAVSMKSHTFESRDSNVNFAKLSTACVRQLPSRSFDFAEYLILSFPLCYTKHEN